MSEIHGVGLGTFPFSNVFSQTSEPEVVDIVEAFIKEGGKYIETAPLYKINDLLKRVLSNIPRDSYFYSTKCVTGVDEKGEKVRSGKYDSIIAQCNLELKSVGLDYIDLYMMHIPPPDTTPEETMSALVDLQRQGKIINIGISNVSLEVLKEFNQYGSIRFVQNRFSLINRSLDKDFIDYCQIHEIKNIPFQVIERGLLTEKVVDGLNLRDGDLRATKPEFAHDVQQFIRDWVKRSLKPIADDLGISISNLAIWWILQQPISPICSVGATNKSQLLDNMRAQNLSLPSNTLDRIESAYSELARNSVRHIMGLV